MNSTENPETLADIVRELRDYADSLDYAGDYEPAPNTEPLRDIADRIEAAAERERNAHTNDIHDALYKATGIPEHAVQVPAGAFAWLFAPAEEGEDHA